MKYFILLIASLLSACSSFTKKEFVPRIIYSDEYTKRYEKTIMRAWKSAEIKISNRNGFKIKLMTNIVVKIENKSAPKAGLLIAGTSKYVNGVGSKITINYVDDKLFEKLEHEFAHAILNSNNIAKGHEEKYDSDFYNWNLSRNLGSG